MNLSKYKTLIFDCDGVVLNSNKVKTEAFYKTALPYGKEAAQKLVDYHVSRGGISRYKKFEWFLESIVDSREGPSLDNLLQLYASEVRHGLLNCEIAKGLDQLRYKTKNSNWLIVSGGDQAELRDVFYERNIDIFFDGGIFGSPDSKDLILEREIANGNIALPALFIGDSKYDFQVSNEMDLDFLFLYEWSEVANWESWIGGLNINFESNLSGILNY